MNRNSDQTPLPTTTDNDPIPSTESAEKSGSPSVPNEYDSTLKWLIPPADETAAAGVLEAEPSLVPMDHPDQAIAPTSLLDSSITPKIPTPPAESSLPLMVLTPSTTFPESTPQPETLSLPNEPLTPVPSVVDSPDSPVTADPSLEKTLDESETPVVSGELQVTESGPSEAEVELLESEDHPQTSSEKEASEYDRFGPTPPPIPSASSIAPALTPPNPVASLPVIPEDTPPLGFDLPEALARRSLQRNDKPWFEVIFDEDYLRTLPFTTQEQTDQEVEFLAESFSYYPGGHILDVACGYGRHALPLAKHGFQVTGIDLSLPLLLQAADEAQKLSLPVSFVHTDLREIAFQSQFDGAYCTLTSFGYFDEETNLKLATSICQAIKPGGRFVLDVLNRDYVVSDLPSRVWWEGNGCVILEEVEFNFQTSRLLIHRSVVFNEGRQVEQDLSLRTYCLHELGKLLRAAGFRVLEVSGSTATRGHFFGAASRQIILICERPKI